MRQRYQAACVAAIAAVVGITALRLAGGAPAAVLGLAALAVVAVFFLCGVARLEMNPMVGVPAVVLSGAAVPVGLSLVVHAFCTIVDLGRDIYPYPQPVNVTAVSRLLAFVLPAGALVGGVFFLVIAVHGWKTRCVTRGFAAGMALAPVIWSWARLLWYMTSFTSAVNRFRSLIEVAVLIFEMLFLFRFARYVSGVEEKAPRFTAAVALCAAALGLSACFTRFGAYLLQDATLFSAGALITAPDFWIALLAGVFAVGQLFGKAEPVAEEMSMPEETAMAEDVTEAEQPTEVSVDETAPTEETTPYQPPELEDIINEIIHRDA